MSSMQGGYEVSDVHKMMYYEEMLMADPEKYHGRAMISPNVFVMLRGKRKSTVVKYDFQYMGEINGKKQYMCKESKLVSTWGITYSLEEKVSMREEPINLD